MTERSHLVALLVPPHPATDARTRLVACGRLRPASRPFALPVRVRVASGTPESGTVLDDLPEDRS